MYFTVATMNGEEGKLNNDLHFVMADWLTLGAPSAWYGLRRDMKELFERYCQKYGVRLLKGQAIKTVESAESAVVLENGARFDADLIIGADGA